MHRSHNVGGVGFDRLNIGIAHKRLSGHVDNDLGTVFSEGRLQFGGVTDITNDAGHAIADLGNFEQARTGRRSQRITHHVRTHRLQPQRYPAPLEAGVPGQQHALAIPECRIQDHTFHGAWPDCHNSSRRILSRRVSIGCQKPWCGNAARSPSSAKRSNGPRSQIVWSSVM